MVTVFGWCGTHRRIPSKNCLPYKIRKIEGVADVCHPTEEIGQAQDFERFWHMHDTLEIDKKRSVAGWYYTPP
jgi:hypothetical protein